MDWYVILIKYWSSFITICLEEETTTSTISVLFLNTTDGKTWWRARCSTRKSQCCARLHRKGQIPWTTLNHSWNVDCWKVVPKLVKLFTKCQKSNDVLAMWRVATNALLYKTDDKVDFMNHHPLNLLSCAYKLSRRSLLTDTLHNRVQTSQENELSYSLMEHELRVGGVT